MRKCKNSLFPRVSQQEVVLLQQAGNRNVIKERGDSNESDKDFEDAMTIKGSDIVEWQIESLIKT